MSILSDPNSGGPMRSQLPGSSLTRRWAKESQSGRFLSVGSREPLFSSFILSSRWFSGRRSTFSQPPASFCPTLWMPPITCPVLDHQRTLPPRALLGLSRDSASPRRRSPACARLWRRPETWSGWPASSGHSRWPRTAATPSPSMSPCSGLAQSWPSTRGASASSTASWRRIASRAPLTANFRRCGSRRTTARRRSSGGGRSDPWTSTAWGRSFRCQGPSGTESRRRTASKSAHEGCWESGTCKTPTPTRGRSGSWRTPPDWRPLKLGTGSKTGDRETARQQLKTGVVRNSWT